MKINTWRGRAEQDHDDEATINKQYDEDEQHNQNNHDEENKQQENIRWRRTIITTITWWTHDNQCFLFCNCFSFTFVHFCIFIFLHVHIYEFIILRFQHFNILGISYVITRNNYYQISFKNKIKISELWQL